MIYASGIFSIDSIPVIAGNTITKTNNLTQTHTYTQTHHNKRTHLAVWNGTWYPLVRAYDNILGSNTIYSLLMNTSSPNNDVILGGEFRSFRSATNILCHSSVTRYTPTNSNLTPMPNVPSNWTEFGGGMVGEVYVIAKSPKTNQIMIGGDFLRISSQVNTRNGAYMTNGVWNAFPMTPPVISDAVWDGSSILFGFDATNSSSFVSINTTNVLSYFEEIGGERISQKVLSCLIFFLFKKEHHISTEK